MSGPAALLVVGDALLDHDVCGRVERLAPDAPVPVVSGPRRTTRPGGAALAACLAAADGRPVTLVTALGDDEGSTALRALLADRVHLVELPLTGALSTKTRILADDRPLLRLDDGEGRAGTATEEARRALAAATAVLVSDYGRGTADVLREDLAAAARRVPVVWDPHPRGAPPVPHVRLVTPSSAEARTLAERTDEKAPDPGEDEGPNHDPHDGEHRHPDGGTPHRGGAGEAGAGMCDVGVAGASASLARSAASGSGGELHAAAWDAARLVRAWRVGAVAVTLGGRGALLSHGETPLLVPSPVSAEGDACGAGDRFAAAAAGLLADGELAETAVRGAVHAATRYVAEGGVRSVLVDAATEEPREDEPTDDALQAAARVRAAGGTVVAAGGCFDLLHAGHVALLQAARRTGDCLVVCVNSDASVRRRKGDGRPLVPEADRIRVLRALECVDAVAVFDEDTPERLLAELRPHIWAKGGDYARTRLPEASLVESWGGQVVLFPYLDGRSTTGIAQRAAVGPRADAGRRSR
ncbi:D-glycero-beta-D-manno-heptose 1-phosphate adenylyltransferase [Streptomyces sp. CdTB01]|uniref:D-glycero-beta-D-manno-heptose 1-phosphate adenylyltransferase n=1 Tax=Streptomyces sp. CdTB01 TaxID=1725411 RepID=UPI00073A71D5|nr:D-glycero-beta-D-manno-heptose 1-phosphate adenylyltransferase [Streptomyces sp. CdTB01]ALV34558.1 D-beta-D-heptose 1-phosphate adenosyltransferase [Streptomyces sp. CdTB01]